MDYSPQGRKESDTTEQLILSLFFTARNLNWGQNLGAASLKS